MKDKFLLLLIGVITLLGCAEFGAFEDKGLDAEAEKQVLKDCVKYLNKTRNDKSTIRNTSIEEYYGTFNGSIVVALSLNGINHQRATRYCFEGVQIWESSGGMKMLVWKKGKVYHITEAWDSGLLAKADMQGIAEFKSGIDSAYIWCSGCQNCDKIY